MDTFDQTANLSLTVEGILYLRVDLGDEIERRRLGSIESADVPAHLERERAELLDAWRDRIDSRAEALAAYAWGLPSARQIGPRGSC